MADDLAPAVIPVELERAVHRGPVVALAPQHRDERTVGERLGEHPSIAECLGNRRRRVGVRCRLGEVAEHVAAPRQPLLDREANACLGGLLGERLGEEVGALDPAGPMRSNPAKARQGLGALEAGRRRGEGSVEQLAGAL